MLPHEGADSPSVCAVVDFVKTCTGFGPAGANVEDVQQMRDTVGTTVGVKAAGGIRALETVRALIAAGATRIGTSCGVSIMEELLAEQRLLENEK
jgi:deoxyribose-phosphate aldolase